MCGWRRLGRWTVVVLTACTSPRLLSTATPSPSANTPALVATPSTPPSSRAPAATPDLRLVPEVLPPELPEFDGKPAELPAAPAGVPREPASCRALSRPAPPVAREGCASRDAAIQLLAEVLATDPEKAARQELVQNGKRGGELVEWSELMKIERHRRQYFELVASLTAEQRRDLHALERCEGFPPGFLRAVRAELARDCAETLAAPLLRRPPPGITAEVVQTLRGLSLASRFVRAVPPSPVMPEPVDEARIDAFVSGPVRSYREVTEARLRQVSAALDTLPAQSHGRAVALAGQAVAWQRLRRLRGQTLPNTLKRTYTLRTRYFERIDTLSAGLAEKALALTREATASASLQGLLRDRALQEHLSQIYGASKLLWVDLPRSTPERQAASPWYRIASRLPARYPAELLAPAELANDETLAELAPGGLSLRQKRALVRPATQGDLRTLAELHLKLAVVLHRDEEIREASRLVDLFEQPTDSDLFLRAATRDLLRAWNHLQTPAAVPAEFVPSALLALADDPRKPEEIRASAGYDAAVLMSCSARMPTLQAAYRRLQAVRDTVSDKVTRDCASAFLNELGDSWRFQPAPACRSWPWLDN